MTYQVSTKKRALEAQEAGPMMKIPRSDRRSSIIKTFLGLNNKRFSGKRCSQDTLLSIPKRRKLSTSTCEISEVFARCLVLNTIESVFEAMDVDVTVSPTVESGEEAPVDVTASPTVEAGEVREEAPAVGCWMMNPSILNIDQEEAQISVKELRVLQGDCLNWKSKAFFKSAEMSQMKESYELELNALRSQIEGFLHDEFKAKAELASVREEVTSLISARDAHQCGPLTVEPHVPEPVPIPQDCVKVVPGKSFI